MSTDISMETKVTLRQAFLIMHAYLSLHYELRDKPAPLGAMLGDLSLWDTESGGKEPMDGAVFPDWLDCARAVMTAEVSPEGYRGADISLDGKPPTIEVKS
ncbi:hypothetical protein [Dyella choica]|uniref:Uncharacterized protein n=1 Tax=Dyella choica TaxID=1927959 RepID=A0A432LZF3_9GAMM|nr:hypothetical protein [Dyella choica]RUL69011.1 hypothetical protein EKH80_23065 [Dyella choica]